MAKKHKTLKEVQSQLSDSLKRIRNAREAFKCFFYKREEVVDLLFLACASDTPLLLVGPPGTAKSDIISKFAEIIGLTKGEYFEYMLTKFSEPAEVFGALDITKLKEGVHSRKTEGMLPTAKVAFLDEIYKGNSAILNSLLTVINEKKFYHEGVPTDVPLQCLIGATNEIPEDDSMKALSDRFVLKVNTDYVSKSELDLRNLIEASLKFENWKYQNKTPWRDIKLSLEDFDNVNAFLNLSVEETNGKSDIDSSITKEAFSLFYSILNSLETEHKVEISDRKKGKMYKLARMTALLDHGGKVGIPDLKVLAYLGNRKEEIPMIHAKVSQIIADTTRKS